MRVTGATTLSRRGACALAAALLSLVGCGATNKASDDATLSDAAATAPATSRGGSVVVTDPYATSSKTTANTTLVATAFATDAITSVRLIGDSITAGYGCDGYGEQTDKIIYQGEEGVFTESGHDFASWANDFRSFATDQGISDDAFSNAGISGARMSWLADEPDAWLEDADLIVVMLGTNDAAWSTADEFETAARIALAAAAECCTHLVVVSPPNNWRDDGRAHFTMTEADKILAQIASASGYIHVSALSAVAPDNGTMNADGIHPTTAGSHAIWNSIAAQLGLA